MNHDRAQDARAAEQNRRIKKIYIDPLYSTGNQDRRDSIGGIVLLVVIAVILLGIACVHF